MILIGQRKTPLITCRGCDCDDDHACEGGCAWVLLDTNRESGICSACAVQVGWHPGWMADVGFREMPA